VALNVFPIRRRKASSRARDAKAYKGPRLYGEYMETGFEVALLIQPL
jgi:hypothetical protein